jgi:hypothetical protein
MLFKLFIHQRFIGTFYSKDDAVEFALLNYPGEPYEIDYEEEIK